MFATLEFRSSVITGTLAGKPLFCLVRPPLPGSEPAAGLYHIQPPVHDVIYGLVAVMAPTGPATAGTGSLRAVMGKQDRPGGVSAKIEWLGGVSAKLESPGGVSAKFSSPPGGVSAKLESPGGVSAKFSDPFYRGVNAKIETPMRGTAASFVLSGRPVPGRHCLVIDSSFADLMDGLRISGGAAIRVA